MGLKVNGFFDFAVPFLKITKTDKTITISMPIPDTTG